MAERKFNDVEFRVSKMSPKPATLMLFRLGKILAPLGKDVKGLIDAVRSAKGGAVNESDAAALTTIAKWFADIDPAVATELVVELAELAEFKDRSGKYFPVVFDAVFENRLLTAFQVAAWVATVNFSSIFTAGGATLGNVPPVTSVPQHSDE